jgi:DNA-binding transcriptional MerR regulator
VTKAAATRTPDAPAGVGDGDGDRDGDRDGELISIGEAAGRLGVSERALRYYQELGLVTPCARTTGGMRRYSEADLQRVARIRELQTLLGLNLDEIAVVLHNDDRMAELRLAYRDERAGATERAALVRESLELMEQFRATVTAKQHALDAFRADVDARIARITDLLEQGERDAGKR